MRERDNIFVWLHDADLEVDQNSTTRFRFDKKNMRDFSEIKCYRAWDRTL